MTRSVQFAYDGHDINMELMERCSVSDHLAEHRTFYEQSFLEEVSKLMPETGLVIDVGAHIGNHTIFFAQVMGFRVLAFEPNPEAFAKLTENVAHAGVADLVTCFEVAVSDRDSTALLTLVSGGDKGTASIEVAGEATHETLASVATVTLDEFLDRVEDIDRPTFVKIDVEGHEASVLRGADAILARSKTQAVSVECMTTEAFDGCLALLGSTFRPRSIANPTPTVIFEHIEGDEFDGHVAEIVRYGIQAASAANRARANEHSLETRLARANASSARTQSRLAATQAAHVQSKAKHALAATELRHTIARERWTSGLLDAMATTHGQGGSRESELVKSVHRIRSPRSKSSTLRRLAIIAIGREWPSPSVASTMVDCVDLIDIRRREGRCEIVHQRYTDGSMQSERVAEHSVIDASLIGADVIKMLSSDYPLDTQSTLCLIQGPERDPGVAQVIVGGLGCAYVLSFAEAGYDGHILRLEAGAAGCFVPDEKLLERWELQHVVGAEICHPLQVDRVVASLHRIAERRSESIPDSSGDVRADHRVLIVSYFALPSTPVSTQRLGYWHQFLGEIAAERGADLGVTWLSATETAAERPGNIVVRDRGDDLVSPALRTQLDEMNQLGTPTIGFSWAENVQREAAAWDERYDTVILSCGPFGYVGLGAFFKQLWDCKVIVDFRDPYGGDPRMNYSLAQRTWLIQHECDALESVDAVVSVNQRCLDVIAPGVDVERVIVSNGYDDSYIDDVLANAGAPHRSPIELVYIGTIYRAWPMDHLLDALSPARYRFTHCGRDQSRTHATEHHVVANNRGFVSDQTELAEIMCRAHAGIVRTGGEATIHTTKIFDYVGCGLDVIIITDGLPETGALHELTADLPGVFWVRNQPAELKAFFDTYTPTTQPRDTRAHFSRRHQTNKLLDTILDGASTTADAQ